MVQQQNQANPTTSASLDGARALTTKEANNDKSIKTNTAPKAEMDDESDLRDKQSPSWYREQDCLKQSTEMIHIWQGDQIL